MAVSSVVYSLSQVAKHNSRKDCWLVIGGKVLDASKYVDEHPGGEDVLIEVAGRDATKEFEAVGHSQTANELLLRFQVGVLKGFESRDVLPAIRGYNTTEASKRRGEGMTGSVIKDDRGSDRRFEYSIEFLVPLVVACLVFWYRFSAAMVESPC